MSLVTLNLVTNSTKQTFLFGDAELSMGDRWTIDPHTICNLPGLHVPWGLSYNGFTNHNMHLIDVATGKVIWWIWQNHDDCGDYVCASRQGWGEPTDSGVYQLLTVTGDMQAVLTVQADQSLALVPSPNRVAIAPEKRREVLLPDADQTSQSYSVAP